MRERRRSGRRGEMAVFFALVVTLGPACPHARDNTAPPEPDTAVLVPTQSLGRPFMARQKVVARHSGGQSSFEAVLQLQGGKLLLLALTPFGSKAFAIEQQGTRLTVESFVEQPLPFSPRYVLVDVHRAFFVGLPGAPLPDGVHRGERAGEDIEERWIDGRLHTRSFERRRGPPGRIVIRYEGGMTPGNPPPTIRFDNGRFGYTLTIETVEHRNL